MCNVYSFSGFAKILIKNRIKFSLRDFLDDNKVDNLIQQLIDNSCDEDSYAGAGIARSCFFDYSGECAIKVDKQFYTDYSDEDARETYSDYLDSYADWEDGGWVIDDLCSITKYKGYCCDQNYDEIEMYKTLIRRKSHILDYLPRLYAISTNKCVEILELCNGCDYDPYAMDTERYEFICNMFDDTHDGNFGVNKQNKLVILDVGFKVDLD